MEKGLGTCVMAAMRQVASQEESMDGGENRSNSNVQRLSSGGG